MQLKVKAGNSRLFCACNYLYDILFMCMHTNGHLILFYIIIDFEGKLSATLKAMATIIFRYPKHSRGDESQREFLTKHVCY